MTRMTGPDCVVMCNLINTYIHTYIHTHRMTRMTGPDCVVMCNLINTYIRTYIHTYIHTYIYTGNRVVGAIVLSPTDTASQEAVVGSAQRVVVERARAPCGADVRHHCCHGDLGS